jgi:hypothetical protein
MKFAAFRSQNRGGSLAKT